MALWLLQGQVALILGANYFYGPRATLRALRAQGPTLMIHRLVASTGPSSPLCMLVSMRRGGVLKKKRTWPNGVFFSKDCACALKWGCQG